MTKAKRKLAIGGAVALGVGVYYFANRRGQAKGIEQVNAQPLVSSGGGSAGGVNQFSPGGSLALAGAAGSSSSPSLTHSGQFDTSPTLRSIIPSQTISVGLPGGGPGGTGIVTKPSGISTRHE